jgi:hypothetical protein
VGSSPTGRTGYARDAEAVEAAACKAVLTRFESGRRSTDRRIGANSRVPFAPALEQCHSMIASSVQEELLEFRRRGGVPAILVGSQNDLEPFCGATGN